MNFVNCPICDGSGRRGDEKCPACDGWGMMTVQEAEKIIEADYRRDPVNQPENA